MTRGRTLHLAALLGTLAAAVVACAVALLAVSGEAEAAFPGKNGRIAYNTGGVIYTINPDGSGKSKVTNTYVSGDPTTTHPTARRSPICPTRASTTESQAARRKMPRSTRSMSVGVLRPM